MWKRMRVCFTPTHCEQEGREAKELDDQVDHQIYNQTPTPGQQITDKKRVFYFIRAWSSLDTTGIMLGDEIKIELYGNKL